MSDKKEIKEIDVASLDSELAAARTLEEGKGDKFIMMASVVAFLMTSFHIYTGFFGLFDYSVQRGVHLGFALTLILLTQPLYKHVFKDKFAGSKAFRAACHRFILMDALLAETKQQENEEKQKRAKNKPAKEEKPKAEQKAEETEDGNVPTPLHKIIEISKSIISEGADADGWMLMSNFVSELYREENSFNPKLYGYRNSKPTSFFKSLKVGGKPVFTLEKKNSVDKIRIASQ